jgi:hypothetical protein
MGNNNSKINIIQPVVQKAKEAQKQFENIVKSR